MSIEGDNVRQNKEMVAKMLEEGYLEYKDEKVAVGVPAFTCEQKMSFDDISRICLLPAAEDYRKGVLEIAGAFESLFPKPLSNDAKRFSAWMYIGLSGFIAEYGLRNGSLKALPESSVCDALVQLRKPE